MHSDKFCILILWTFKVVSDAVKFPSANFVFSICCTVCFFLLPFLVLVEYFYDSILYIFLTHKLYFCFIFSWFFWVCNIYFNPISVSLLITLYPLMYSVDTSQQYYQFLPYTPYDMSCIPLPLYQILQKYLLDKLTISKNRLFILPLFIYPMLLYLYGCLNACPPWFSFSLKNSSSYLAGQMCW